MFLGSFFVSIAYSQKQHPTAPRFQKITAPSQHLQSTCPFYHGCKTPRTTTEKYWTKKKKIDSFVFFGGEGSHIFDRTSSATNPTVCTWICRGGDRIFQEKYFPHILWCVAYHPSKFHEQTPQTAGAVIFPAGDPKTAPHSTPPPVLSTGVK